jgi:hypothetical protein
VTTQLFRNSQVEIHEQSAEFYKFLLKGGNVRQCFARIRFEPALPLEIHVIFRVTTNAAANTGHWRNADARLLDRRRSAATVGQQHEGHLTTPLLIGRLKSYYDQK